MIPFPVRNDMNVHFFLRFRNLRSWIVIVLAITGLFLLGRRHPWLQERLSPTPVEFYLCWGLIFVPAILFQRYVDWWWKTYFRCSRYCSNRQKRSPVWFYAVVFFLAVGLFWFFRVNRSDSGDIWHFEHAAEQGYAFLVEHAPLETLIRCWISEILRVWPETNLVLVYRWFSCVLGGFYVLAVIFLCSRAERTFSWFAPLFLFITPVLGIYCGYQEVYGLPVFLQVIFLFSGLFFLWNRISISWVSGCFSLAICTGFWNGILGFAYLYLFWKAWRSSRIGVWDGFIQLLIVVAPALVSLALLEGYANPFAGISERLGKPNLLIPINQTAQTAGYTTFSAVHLADFANELILVGLAPMVLMLTRLLHEPRRMLDRLRRSTSFFLMLAAVPVLALGFLYYSFIGFPLDWDLYTFMFPSLSFLGVAIMGDTLYSRAWRKRVLALFLIGAAIASAWILQNALFWRYPLFLRNVGPFVSVLVPDFYYRQMGNAFDAGNEYDLYWLADQALRESPDKYQEILRFMDDWTISSLVNLPPRAFDYAGWACDMAIYPGSSDQLCVFDKYGRIFFHRDLVFKWIYALEKPLSDPIVAGDFALDGAAILLSAKGEIVKIPKTALESGISGEVIWGSETSAITFLPDSPSSLNLPVSMVDLAIRKGDGEICVLDNFNRVWETSTGTLVLQGIPSYREAIALHFSASDQPVTIDVHNRLSFDKDKLTLPFETSWFYPIVRDFAFTTDERGMQTLDLNGNIHYIGSTLVYEDTVMPGEIVDRYVKILPIPLKDRLVLLDNRYRIVETDLDASGFTTRQKISGMINAGNYATAYNALSLLWLKGSQFTSICYDLIDTEMARAVRGMPMYKTHEAVPMYVDILPLSEELLVLLDRWGRIIYEKKGVLNILDGSGLTNWPHYEAIDGASGKEQILFLCKDGTVWEYRFPHFLGEDRTPFGRAPTLWVDLNDIEAGKHWIGVEIGESGDEFYALSADGILLCIDLHGKALSQRVQIPTPERSIFDFALKKDEFGLAIAYTSRSGPAYLYTQFDNQNRDIQQSRFGWDVICDIQFSQGDNVVLLDRFGVLHQYVPVFAFSETPYTSIMDAAAIRFLSHTKKVIWLRNNGEIKRLRYQ